jgi:hypothetical protein
VNSIQAKLGEGVWVVFHLRPRLSAPFLQAGRIG